MALMYSESDGCPYGFQVRRSLGCVGPYEAGLFTGFRNGNCCVVKDANKWKVDPERTVIEVRCWILQKLAGEGLGEAAFMFCRLGFEGGST